MTLVVGASLLAAPFVDSGPAGQWAKSVLSFGRLRAPESVLAESANIVRRLEGSRRISRTSANAVAGELTRLTIDLCPYRPFADRIWELRHDLTPYDAWYVALAEELSSPLATLDRRLANATGPHCRFIAFADG